MASPLNETIENFVEDVFSNETLTQDERKQFILSAMLSLENKITDRSEEHTSELQSH